MSKTFKPTEAMASAARRAKKMRDAQPPSNRGMTETGLARMGQLINREPLSLDTVKRMYSFFSRHEVDKKSKSWKDGNSKAEQAWLGWGGDAGYSWSRKIVQSEEKEAKSNMIKKEGDKWILYTKDGSKKLGEHDSEADAVKQEQAIKAQEAKGNKQIRVNVVTQVNASGIRREIRDGQEYVILPSRTLPGDTVMNRGLYMRTERDRSYTSLEGSHAPIGHPHKANGDFVSAKDPDAVANGFLIGAKNENVRLDKSSDIVLIDKAIPVESASNSEVGRELLKRIEDLEAGHGEPIHTSTGLLLNVERLPEPKVNSKGDEYDWIARDMDFDHDAILLDEPGANTPDQNVGIFANSDGTQVMQQFAMVNLEEKESLLDKAVNRILSALGIKDAASYNNDGGRSKAEIKSNQADEVAMDRKQMEALAKNMGYKYNEDMSDEDMYNGMMDYAKKNGMKPKVEEKKEEMKNSAEDISAIVEAAVNAAVKPLQDQLNAQGEAELSQLAADVAGLNMGINEGAAKAMGVNACRDFLAANQPAYSIGATAFRGNKQTNALDGMEAPE